MEGAEADLLREGVNGMADGHRASPDKGSRTVDNLLSGGCGGVFDTPGHIHQVRAQSVFLILGHPVDEFPAEYELPFAIVSRILSWSFVCL